MSLSEEFTPNKEHKEIIDSINNFNLEDDIIHRYPKFSDKNIIYYRYDQNSFEKYKKITESIENYEKWKIGINYETNRKIKIDGPTYNRLKLNFLIRCGNSWSLFTELNGINMELYLQETEKLKNKALLYDKKIDDIICKINKLEKWNNFIEFEGVKYGIPEVYNNIHRKNDCNGNMEKIEYFWECRKCSGAGFYETTCNCENRSFVKCLKCGFKE